jgi:alkanesulfonate monooxygenase SsuD/methylene tetrahydromethanopterin reductase-like flavin-dependent oxidoreductase (luciferase family)
MVHCAPTKEEAYAVAKNSFEWYPKAGGAIIGSVAEWMEEKKMALGTYDYAATSLEHKRAGSFEHLTFDYIHESGSGVVGDPEECIETLKRYEAAGCDLMLCLVNPYDIPHEKVMQSIELMGKEVIPAFR